MMKFLLLAGLALTAVAKLSPGHHPLIVAGPFLGQNLEFFNDNPFAQCYTHGEWKWIWGNPNISTSDIPCLLDSLGLVGWDDEKKRVVPKPHVYVRPRGGYNGSGLDAVGTFGTKTFLDGANVDDQLGPRLRALGYVDDESFIGEGYDYRLGVRDWQLTSFPALRRKIEVATQKAGAGAVLAGLSMAGPYLHSFLSWADVESPGWAKSHIHAFVPVASPWNGAVFAVSAVVSSVLQTQNQSGWTHEGHCPRCDPPKADANVSDSIADDWVSWATALAMERLDKGLQKMSWTWPAMYYMSTGVDYSTVPPTDPVVLTMKNGDVPPQCSVSVPLASTCGAEQLRKGVKFDSPNYLAPTQCAECYEVLKVFGKGPECEAGYETAAAGTSVKPSWLCCKRHECMPKSYHASELPDFLEKVGRAEAAQMMRYAQSMPTSRDPGVPVHCIFSQNIQSFNAIAMNTSEDVGKKSMVTLDDGDQIVNADSLEVCTRWPSTLKTYRIPGGRHGHLYDVEQVVDVIVAVATNDEARWKNWRQPVMTELKVTSNKTLVKKDFLLIQRDSSLLSVVV